MTDLDGTILGIAKIVDMGPPEELFNILLISEGYREEEMPKWYEDATYYVNRLFSMHPFDKDLVKKAINVYRLDVTSIESGADDPAECGGTGAMVRTFFDSTFCSQGPFPELRRAMHANLDSLLMYAGDYLPEWHRIVLIVNSPIYGGIAHPPYLAMSSTASHHWRGAPCEWPDITIHELGHTFGLADEYPYYRGCGVGVDSTEYNRYPGGETYIPNLSDHADRATIKWSGFVLPATPMPTTQNADCSDCDHQPSPVPSGTVGAFEGGGHHHCGVFRPEFDCLMNLGIVTGSRFCAVCQLQIERYLSPYCLTFIIKIQPRKVTVPPGDKIKYKVRIETVPDSSFDIDLSVKIYGSTLTATYNLGTQNPPYPKEFETEITIPSSASGTYHCILIGKTSQYSATSHFTVKISRWTSWNRFFNWFRRF